MFALSGMACIEVTGEEGTFLLEVERVRVELRDKVARAHQLLQEREAILLSELQQLEATYRGEGVTEQLKQLRILKDNTVSTLKANENQEFLIQNVAHLDARMREIESKLQTARDTMRGVELEWDGNLEGILSSTGSIRIKEAASDTKKGNPKVTAGKQSYEISSKPGVFYYPESIDIHPRTNNIYVCDGVNNRVQVFNKSLVFLFLFSEKMNGPFGICVTNENVYVTQLATHSLSVYSTEGTCRQSVGRRGLHELEFEWPRGIAVSTEKQQIYICDNGNHRIQCLNLDLTFNNEISSVNYPRGIKLTSQHIVVLKVGANCISFYDYSHQLIRELITMGDGKQVVDPWHFCIDGDTNIVITDPPASCVLIFSHKGELIHKFGKKGEDEGDFISPTGVAVNSENKIIVISRNPNHAIQLF